DVKNSRGISGCLASHAIISRGKAMSSRIVEYCCCSPRCKSSFYSSFAPLIVQSKQLVQAGVVGGRPSQANDKDILCAHTYLQRRYCNILVVHAAAAYSTTNCPNYPQDWKKSI
ncbi:unnamed protein product, partial [Pylaiella littoralis]